MARKRSFEQMLSELEKIVETLEHGDLPLEEALKLFEKGIKLSRSCSENLNRVEKRIKMLVQTSEGNHKLEDWQAPSDS